MKQVLALGNGISRLAHEGLIKKWKGEVWGCNYAYTEFPKQLTRLFGHRDVMHKAIEHRNERGYVYQIWTGDKELLRTHAADGVQSVTCPGEHRKDSGTTIISQALAEGYDDIKVCGFDLGGRDIYTIYLHLHNKISWVRRWRSVRHTYGKAFDRAIHFVGYDHLPYIQSDDADYAYYDRYRAELPHIPDPEYIAIFWMLYGKHYTYKRELNPMVRVRYIKGNRIGWETKYKRSIAEILAGRGEIEIIGDPPADDDITADMTVTARMTKETLLKIAGLRGIEISNPNDTTKAQIVELLQETAD